MPQVFLYLPMYTNTLRLELYNSVTTREKSLLGEMEGGRLPHLTHIPLNHLSFWQGVWASWASPVAQLVKNPPAILETWVQSLGQEDPLKKEMANCSSILAWRIPWTEEPGGLQSTGLQDSDTTYQLNSNNIWELLVSLGCKTQTRLTN